VATSAAALVTSVAVRVASAAVLAGSTDWLTKSEVGGAIADRAILTERLCERSMQPWVILGVCGLHHAQRCIAWCFLWFLQHLFIRHRKNKSTLIFVCPSFVLQFVRVLPVGHVFIGTESVIRGCIMVPQVVCMALNARTG
jgi:hypothetical protein